MKELIISKGQGENLFGFVIPAGAIFGAVNGRYYVCYDFTEHLRKLDGFYNFLVYSPKRARFEINHSANNRRIHDLIEQYLKLHPNKKGTVCPKPELRTRTKNRAFHARKKAEAEERREWADFMHENAPRERKPQTGFTGAYSQSVIDGKGYNLDWEYNVQELPNIFRGGDPGTVVQSPHLFRKPFEHGQETAGNNGRYTVSPDVYSRRDGMKTSFKDYRPKNNRPKYTPGKAEVDAWWESMHK